MPEPKPQPQRVGLVGVENTHATEIVRYLNNTPDTAARVTALVAGSNGQAEEIAQLGDIDRIATSSQELLGDVDALVVTNRDGAQHAAEALPFLQAGVPVWVDKPLAAGVADGEAILSAARAAGAPVTSYSALRWVADTTAAQQAMADVGEVQAVTVTGPANPDSEYSGIFFYGIHAADVAQRLVPGTPEGITIRRLNDTVLVRYSIDGVEVTLQLVRPDDQGRVPFHISVAGRHGMLNQTIDLGEDYCQPGIDVFEKMLTSGTEPISHEQMLAPIHVLETVQNLL